MNATDMSGADKDSHLSLQAYLLQVQGIVKQQFGAPTWVIAELSDFRLRANGHCYMSLIESTAGKEIAKCSASMMPGVANLQLKAFRIVTQSDPTPGMKLLLNVSASFHPQYGFQLQVHTLDGNYTAGEMKAQVEKIIDQLKREGYYDNQKKLPSPAGFWRVAVVSPEQAAGLGDFQRDADRLHSYGLVQFVYYEAIFQGDKAPDAIKEAIRNVYADHQNHPYDAVCLIRGGGAKADLAWLNDYRLALWICKIPIPVFTGIGHERDETILDLVAHTRFDTPSKVVSAIMRHLQNDADDLERVIASGTTEAERLVTHEDARLQDLDSRFHQAVTTLIYSSEQDFNQLVARLKIASQTLLHDQSLLLQQLRSSADHLVLAQLTFSATYLSDISQRYKTAVSHTERYAADHLQQVWNEARNWMRALLQQEINTYKQFNEAYRKLVPAMLGSEDTWLQDTAIRAGDCSTRLLERQSRELQHAAQQAATLTKAMVDAEESRLRMLIQRFTAAALSKVQSEEQQLGTLSSLFAALDPRSVMAKGFAMVKTKGGKTHRSATTIVAGEALVIQFYDGEVEAVAKTGMN